MSWSISTRGTAEEIGKAFDETRGEAKAAGMIKAELADIDAACDFAVDLASSYEYVSVQAGGHWSVFGPDDPRNKFGSVHITINAIGRPTTTAATGADQEKSA